MATPGLELTAPRSTREWFEHLYSELQLRARGELFRHQVITLGPNTLLHEAWLQFGDKPVQFASQAELIAYAGRAMRGIVIDHIRARQANKRGGTGEDLPYETLVDLRSVPDTEVIGLNDALQALAAADPALAELVELKFFGGLTLAEIAALRQVSERTTQRDWEKARIYLYSALKS